MIARLSGLIRVRERGRERESELVCWMQVND